MPETPFASIGAASRLVAGLNGMAALMIAAFALGVIGGDVDPPDLGALLACFLAGLAASGLAIQCAVLAQSPWTRMRAGRRWVAMLAALSFAAALAAFGAGCWLAVVQSPAGGGDDATQTLYATGDRA